MIRGVSLLAACGIVTVATSSLAFAEPLGTAFTYQGALYDADAPVTGACDFEFTLWDDGVAGVQVGGVVGQTLDVDAGTFSTVLDFGAGAFVGNTRWLQIDV